MNVTISPNIKKVSERIDPQGNIIDARTKQIIEKNEPEPIFTEQEAPPITPKIEPQGGGMAEKIQSMVEEKINAKINEIVDKKVAEILSKL